MPTFEEKLAALRAGTSFEEKLKALRSGQDPLDAGRERARQNLARIQAGKDLPPGYSQGEGGAVERETGGPSWNSYSLEGFGDRLSGIAKGALNTATGLLTTTSPLGPAYQAYKHFNGEPQFMQDVRGAMEPVSEAESFGKGAEQMAEFIMPQGAVNSAAARLAPKIGPKVAMGVTSGLSDAAVTMAQTGDPTTAAAQGGASGLISAILTPKAKQLSKVAQAAERAGIDLPLTKAEGYANKFMLKIEHMLRSSAGGKEIYQEAVTAPQDAVLNAAKNAAKNRAKGEIEGIAARKAETLRGITRGVDETKGDIAMASEKAQTEAAAALADTAARSETLIKRATENARRMGEVIGAGFAQVKKIDTHAAGQFVQEAVGKVKDQEGAILRAVKNDIFNAIGDPPINFDNGLARTAQEILQEPQFTSVEKVPDLKKQESISRAVGILKQFASGMKQEAELVPMTEAEINALRGQGVEAWRAAQANNFMREVVTDVPITAKEADALRTRLFKMTETGELDLGKETIARLNSALDTAMKEAIDGAGAAGGKKLSEVYQEASTRFRVQVSQVEEGILKTLAAKTDPAEVLDYILAHPQESALRLRNVFDGKQMQQVEEALWSRILSESSEDGIPVAKKMEKLLGKLGAEGVESLFPGGKKLEEMQAFLRESEALSNKTTRYQQMIEGATKNMTEAAKANLKAKQAELDAIEAAAKQRAARLSKEVNAEAGSAVRDVRAVEAARLSEVGGVEKMLRQTRNSSWGDFVRKTSTGGLAAGAASASTAMVFNPAAGVAMGAGVVGLYFGPLAMAKIMAKPQGVAMLRQGLHMVPGTPEAIRLGARLTAIAAGKAID